MLTLGGREVLLYSLTHFYNPSICFSMDANQLFRQNVPCDALMGDASAE